eukprot:TRINITY_DN19456_c0_g1_i3.p1 TRINITY_DN19456_c0_g1~~TRINITY_DN19456_c0_g1_i3.p1  ORF type:complete len:438 (+),score=97.88 TRINITY_DN19456_c0_g1_i3:196-1314(+)
MSAFPTEHFVIEFRPELRGGALLRHTRTRRLLAAKAPGKWGVSARRAAAGDPLAAWRLSPANCSGTEADCFGELPRAADYPALAALAAPMPLFASPKPPTGEAERADLVRAARAWAALRPHVAPVLLSESAAVGRLAAAANVTVVSAGLEQHSRFRRPTYRGLFRIAARMHPAAQYLVYANSDLLLTSSLLESADAALRFRAARFPKHLLFLTGRRTNADVPGGWAAGTAGWEAAVEALAEGSDAFQPDAEDYFLLPREVALLPDRDFPDFVVGGRAFDNWLVTRAVSSSRTLTVDASRTVAAVHQNHDRNRSCGAKCSHTAAGRLLRSQYNARLAEAHGGVAKGRTSDCEFTTVRTAAGVRLFRPDELFLD